MAGIDAFGQPTWTDADPVDLGVQLTTAADSLAHGPYRRGTASERATVDPIYDGLLWWQTDGKQGWWRVESGAWRYVPPQPIGLTFSGTTNTYGVVSVAHGQPTQPKGAVVSLRFTADAVNGRALPHVRAITATQIQVGVFRADTAGVFANQPISGDLVLFWE